jgi:hypothetical protein
VHAVAPVAPSHSIAPQQSVLPVHAVPTPWQHSRSVGDAAQRRPVQQSVAAAHVAPAAWQAAAAWHVPDTQVVPAQQSLSSVQAAPSAWQAHAPDVASQSI